MGELNKGFDMEVYGGYKAKVQSDLRHADRDKLVEATWLQGEEVRVTLGDRQVTIGADDGLNMMEMLLASLVACDVTMVGLHASFMGLKINGLRGEARGHFNVAAYLGIEDAPGPGYESMTMTIYLDAPDATPEQIERLKHICETRSPVGDTLNRSVPVVVEVVPEG